MNQQSGGNAAHPTRIQVAIAEDYGVVREALRHLLNAQEGLEVVGEAADGHEAMRLVASTDMDVLLLDLGMPHMDGLEALSRIRAAAPHVGVVVLSSHPAALYADRALEAGASSYVEKVTDVDRLMIAIRAAAVESCRRAHVMHLPN